MAATVKESNLFKVTTKLIYLMTFYFPDAPETHYCIDQFLENTKNFGDTANIKSS